MWSNLFQANNCTFIHSCTRTFTCLLNKSFIQFGCLFLSSHNFGTMEFEPTGKKLKIDGNEVITEGKAKILVTNKDVFYNPVQEFNRDLSIAVLTHFAKQRRNEFFQKSSDKTRVTSGMNEQTLKYEGITILEALAATGLRSIRYAKEIPDVKQVFANDISAKAVNSIQQNVAYNNVEDLVTPCEQDATMIMYQHRKNRFDAIDLDPYGCPSMFLDAVVQSVADGGIILVTATDMAVLAGNASETCYVKYGAVSLKSKACHEMALRILLQHIASHAGRYGRYIVPLLSVSVDFYIRVFVKLHTSQIMCKENSSKIGLVFQCAGCESFTVQSLHHVKPNNPKLKVPNVPPVDTICKVCQHKHYIGGPIWLGPLHDQSFVSQMLCSLEGLQLNTLKRIEGILTMIHEEVDVPLYYALERLVSIIKCTVPPMKMFRSAILNAGYKVSYSHACKTSVKTDAPNYVIWDIVKAWEKENPVKRDRLQEGSPALAILNTPSTISVSFACHPHANPVSRQMRLSRFQQNPLENWGPGVRSQTRLRDDIDNQFIESKKVRNQNKNSKKKAPKQTTNVYENVINAGESESV